MRCHLKEEIKMKEAFTKTIVLSPIIKVTCLLKKFRKFWDIQRKLKVLLISEARNNSLIFFPIYTPTCTHTHTLLFMFLKTNMRYLLMTKIFSYLLLFFQKILGHLGHFPMLTTVFPQWQSFSKKLWTHLYYFLRIDLRKG